MILEFSNLTLQQIVASLLAIPAFVPATVCTGYVTAWFTNLHNFRRRSLVERLFWSLPLSLAVSPISSVLIGRYLSLSAVVVFYVASAALSMVIFGREWFELRRSREKWNIGWYPLGGKALLLSVIWISVAVLSLVDIQSHRRLFMSVAMLDQGARANWTESVVHTGIPPVNPMYMYKHPATMRNYYFWYVVCAAVTRATGLSARAVLTASSAWAGLALMALEGLYLKHFLAAGARLRKHFVQSTILLTVTGLDICAVLWNLFYLHIPPQAEIEFWSTDPVFSWLNTLLWSPNHIAALICCMLAFLLAWMPNGQTKRPRMVAVGLISVACASAFGLSLYVTFAFFLVTVAWFPWQLLVEHRPRPAFLLVTGGLGAAILLIPYLNEMLHASSGIRTAPFAFAVREIIPPGDLMSSHAFRELAIIHPLTASNLAKLILLVPGYALEFGFYGMIFLIYLIPAWRGGIALTPEKRSLLFIAATTLPFITFVRSGVLKSNDFGWRGALLIQFSVLLLAPEVITKPDAAHTISDKVADHPQSPVPIIYRLRSITSLALILGMLGTLCQGLMLRFVTTAAEWRLSDSFDPKTRSISHNAYISAVGYKQLNALIPSNAVVQFNPIHPEPFWMAADQIGVNHQTAISSDQLWCGSEVGGDPQGCPEMASAVDAIFSGEPSERVRATCHEYGIQYLIARIYDRVWNEKDGWVWQLKPLVSDKEFRVLDCR